MKHRDIKIVLKIKNQSQRANIEKAYPNEKNQIKSNVYIQERVKRIFKQN